MSDQNVNREYEEYHKAKEKLAGKSKNPLI